MARFTTASVIVSSGLLALMGAPAVTAAASASASALGNKDSTSPDISANGRFIVFSSEATNLVPGDTNGKRDIFIRDTVASTTKRVSVAKSGAQTNQNSDQATVSNDGRYVAFVSTASNLVPGDTNGKTDVFRKDLTTGAVVRVSVGAGAKQGNNGSNSARLRPDGKAVVFSSLASNLVTADTNGKRDLFIRDLVANTTKRISVSPSGAKPQEAYPEVDYSTDGNKVAWFRSVCNTAACTSGTGSLMLWSANTGTSAVLASDSWSGEPFYLGSIRAGQTAVGLTSFGSHDGYLTIRSATGGELYGTGCDICAFDLAASGSTGALGAGDGVALFSKSKPWKTLDASRVYTTTITPDARRIAFETNPYNGTDYIGQICLWNTSGTTAAAISLPSGQSAACPSE